MVVDIINSTIQSKNSEQSKTLSATVLHGTAVDSS
jgi:hypothetical protein